MKNNYLLDGNNIIHKMPKLSKLAKKQDQHTREKLAFLVDRYFSNKNIKCTLFFDGFIKESIKTNKIKIQYSNNKTADELIRSEIERAANPKLYTIISSDNDITELAKVCSCKIIKSDEFVKLLDSSNEPKVAEIEEREIINKLNNEDWLRCFNEGNKLL